MSNSASYADLTPAYPQDSNILSEPSNILNYVYLLYLSGIRTIWRQ